MIEKSNTLMLFDDNGDVHLVRSIYSTIDVEEGIITTGLSYDNEDPVVGILERGLNSRCPIHFKFFVEGKANDTFEGEALVGQYKHGDGSVGVFVTLYTTGEIKRVIE